MKLVPIGQISVCESGACYTNPTMHQSHIPQCNRDMHICEHFCYKMCIRGIFGWCIVGFVGWIWWVCLDQHRHRVHVTWGAFYLHTENSYNGKATFPWQRVTWAYVVSTHGQLDSLSRWIWTPYQYIFNLIRAIYGMTMNNELIWDDICLTSEYPWFIWIDIQIISSIFEAKIFYSLKK